MGGGDEHVVDVGTLLSSMNQKLRAIDGKPNKEVLPTIYRVLPSIRDEDPGAYDPKIISIGPFHKGKEALQPMERLKWRFLNDLIHRSPSNSLEKYINVVSSLEPKARKCYSTPIKLDPDSFVETMVLDGCFIVEFLIKWYRADEDGQLYAVNWNFPLLRNDLLLLENQLPFFVLESLFDLSDIQDKHDEHPITLTELAMHYVTNGKMDPSPNPSPILHHLLHLFHSTLHPTRVLDGSEAYPCIQPVMNATKKVKHLVFSSFLWVLSLFLYCRRPPAGRENSRAPRTIPNAVQLQEAGVKFKKKEGRCFLDVGFIDGTMEMSLVSIQAATISQYRNLIAFEQCCPKAGSHFTAFVALMDNLIDTSDDVEVLEGCGILESKLGDEEEVSHFFNSLGKGAYLDYENHYLKGLFKDVKNYRDAATHRWRAMLVHDYFSNPWSIISLVAATVLLILTALQTFFTVFPYYHPKHP